MAYTEEEKKYARDWYHRNKVRLKNDPNRKARHILKRDARLANMKLERQTNEYKAYMKEYRKRNIENVREQERKRSARYLKKQTENLTDAYIISQIQNTHPGNLSAAEIRKMPDIIDEKRKSIIEYRKRVEVLDTIKKISSNMKKPVIFLNI